MKVNTKHQWHAQNGVNFKLKLELEVQGQLTTKFAITLHMFGFQLHQVLSYRSELKDTSMVSCQDTLDIYTDSQTEAVNQGQNWPRETK